MIDIISLCTPSKRFSETGLYVHFEFLLPLRSGLRIFQSSGTQSEAMKGCREYKRRCIYSSKPFQCGIPEAPSCVVRRLGTLNSNSYPELYPDSSAMGTRLVQYRK